VGGLIEKSEGKNHLVDPEVDWTLFIKKKLEVCELGGGKKTVVWCCEHGNESAVSIKCEKFPE